MLNTKIIDDSFGIYLRDVRASSGFTLSDYCLKTGRDVGIQSKLERGLIPPPCSVSALKKILEPLSYSPREFMEMRLIACLYWQRHYEEKVKRDFGDAEQSEEKQTWKIVGTSNFDKETVDEILACDSIADHALGVTMLTALNDAADPHGTYYYHLVDQEKPLYKWEP